MKRLPIILLLLLLVSPDSLISLAYLEPGETAINVGLLSSNDRHDMLMTIREEFGGVLVKEIEDLNAAHATVIGVAAIGTPTQGVDFRNYGYDNV